MLRHSHSMMNHQDKNSQIFIKKMMRFQIRAVCVSLFLVLFHCCKYWRTLPAPFYRRGIKCCSTSNTWTTEQGWHVNIEWVLLRHFSHPMLIFALFISISFHRSAAHQFPVTCSQRKTGQRWHVNNCEHWKISALLVAIPCQQTVSTNFLRAQSRCNRQTHKVLTSHTHRNLFSLISLQLWIGIFVLETEMPVIIAIHCSSRAVFCFEISREPRLFILAGRQVFAGLIGLLLDLRGK